tara:strand:+ start:604 stop:1038 length:435 start_codon:yes stop_codon:yes gene_type:complete
MNKPMAKQYMTTDLITLEKDMNVYYAIGILLNNNISGAPVIDKNKKLIGILSEKDCLEVFAESAQSDIAIPSAISLGRGTVEQFMTKSISTIKADDDLYSVVDIFLKNNFRRLPVLEDDELVGQISRRDILKAIKDITNNNDNY